MTTHDPDALREVIGRCKAWAIGAAVHLDMAEWLAVCNAAARAVEAEREQPRPGPLSQPTADELVLAVGAALGATPLGSAYMAGKINRQKAALAAERAIRDAFAAGRK